MVEYHHIDISVDKAIRYLEEHDEELFAVFQPFFIELQRFCTEYRHNYKDSFKDEEEIHIVSARN